MMAVRDLGVAITLVGPEQRIREEIRRQGWRFSDHIEILNATEVIAMNEPVVQALRKKRNSTIGVGLRYVQEAKAQGFVSAGNTGAAMAAAKMTLKTLGPIDRPALATVLPTLTGRGVVLIDVGANAECRAHHMLQFAIMGDIFARTILGVKTPRVGLMSIGEEEVKGNELTREAHKLLERSDLNFMGNIEGRNIYTGEVDLVVCDGFTGNVIIKTSEGVFEMLLAGMREELTKTMQTKVGALLSRPAFRNFKRRFDYSEFGGAPLLGVRGVSIICHGRSTAAAIRNAVKVAVEATQHHLVQHMDREFSRDQVTPSLPWPICALARAQRLWLRRSTPVLPPQLQASGVFLASPFRFRARRLLPHSWRPDSSMNPWRANRRGARRYRQPAPYAGRSRRRSRRPVQTSERVNRAVAGPYTQMEPVTLRMSGSRRRAMVRAPRTPLVPVV
jgi:glycerol-3-phosphate acyltransferase PlsX